MKLLENLFVLRTIDLLAVILCQPSKEQDRNTVLLLVCRRIHLHRGIGQAVRLAFLQSGYNLGICSRNSIPEFTTVGIISQRAVVFVGDFTVACYRGEGDADGVASCHFLELNGLKTVGSIALTIRGCCTCGILVLIIVHRDGVHCIAAIRRDVYRQILAVHHIVIVGACLRQSVYRGGSGIHAILDCGSPVVTGAHRDLMSIVVDICGAIAIGIVAPNGVDGFTFSNIYFRDCHRPFIVDAVNLFEFGSRPTHEHDSGLRAIPIRFRMGGKPFLARCQQFIAVLRHYGDLFGLLFFSEFTAIGVVGQRVSSLLHIGGAIFVGVIAPHRIERCEFSRHGVVSAFFMEVLAQGFELRFVCQAVYFTCRSFCPADQRNRFSIHILVGRCT